MLVTRGREGEGEGRELREVGMGMSETGRDNKTKKILLSNYDQMKAKSIGPVIGRQRL
jgi:hypothetical protein